jgi:hypothetical protein
MGLVDRTAVEAADANDRQLWDALQRVAANAGENGVGLRAGSHLRATSLGEAWDVDLVRNLVDQLGDALEGSPLPSREIPELVRVLGWPLLVRLSSGVEVSLRRYARDERVAPDDLANRLHVLALIVADLRGGYNDFGVRRWFERPRMQLGGRRPQDILEGDWAPHAADVQGVRDLAAWVAEPTAAS